MRKTAAIAAAGITALSGARPLEQHVLDLELERALPRLAGELAAQPTPVRAAFVDYAGDRQLVLSARLALLRHPAMTRSVLETFGSDPMFAQILRRHGPAAVPPVHYFMLHDEVHDRVWVTRRLDIARHWAPNTTP